MQGINKEFTEYLNARRKFVQEVAEKATRPENIDVLMSNHVIELLRPLLFDNYGPIQRDAALALGRLANYSEEIAQMIVEANVLPEIVAGLASTDEHYQTNCTYVIRQICKHSSLLAQRCVEACVLEPLVNCLKSFAPKVRESAAWALACIATHTPELAQAVVDANALEDLVRCIQDPELALKRIAVASIGDIAKHTPELANATMGAVRYIAPLLASNDAKLGQQVCKALAMVAKHSTDTAEAVAVADTFPKTVDCLADSDPDVCRAAASLIQQVAKQTQELAQMIVNIGGGAGLMNYLGNERNDPLPATMAVGFIAAWSQTLAMTLINEKAPTVVLNVFLTTKRSEVKATAAWTLGQLGKHSPEHAKQLTQLNALSLLLQSNQDPAATDDLRLKTKRALKLIIEKTTDIEALQTLIKDAPDKIVEYALKQISLLLPKNPKARVPFVTSGGFPQVQQIKAQPGSKVQEYIDAINACYPEEARHFYSPEYPAALLQAIENA